MVAFGTVVLVVLVLVLLVVEVVVLELVVLVLVVDVVVLLELVVLVLVEVVVGADVVVVVVEPGPVWARAAPGASVVTKTAMRTPIMAVGAFRVEASALEQIPSPRGRWWTRRMAGKTLTPSQ